MEANYFYIKYKVIELGTLWGFFQSRKGFYEVQEEIIIAMSNTQHFCPACAKFYEGEPTQCRICDLPLNEPTKTLVIDNNLAESQQTLIENKKAALNDALNATKGTSYHKLILESLKRLSVLVVNQIPVETNHDVESLKNLIIELVNSSNKTIHLIDDSPDRVTLHEIKENKGNIALITRDFAWGKLFETNEADRALQLLAGYKQIDQDWFEENLKRAISKTNELYYATQFEDAKHSVQLKKLIKASISSLKITPISYKSEDCITNLLKNLCANAPLSAPISLKSASVDEDGNVTYNEISLIEDKEFVNPEKSIKISVKSNVAKKAESWLLLEQSNETYGKKLMLEPNGKKDIEIWLRGRRVSDIVIDAEQADKITELPTRPNKINLSNPKVEVWFALDTIVQDETGFDSRKKVITDVIDMFEKHAASIDMSYHLYAYSCKWFPTTTSRPEVWPQKHVVSSQGDQDQIKNFLNTIKMTGYNGNDVVPLFTGFLEKVFEQMQGEINKQGLDNNRSRFFIIVGNHPANPNRDLRGLHCVKLDALKLFDGIQQHFKKIQVVHDQSLTKTTKVAPKQVKDYYKTFWETIQNNGRILKWQNNTASEIVNDMLDKGTIQGQDLLIPQLTLLNN